MDTGASTIFQASSGYNQEDRIAINNRHYSEVELELMRFPMREDDLTEVLCLAV